MSCASLCCDCGRDWQERQALNEFHQHHQDQKQYQFEGKMQARLVSIIDGDTIVVERRLDPTSRKSPIVVLHVRLYGIDTAEMKSDGDQNQKHKASKAKEALEQLICRRARGNLKTGYFVWLHCLGYVTSDEEKAMDEKQHQKHQHHQHQQQHQKQVTDLEHVIVLKRTHHDKYGRVSAYVYFHKTDCMQGRSESSVNQWLIANGHAKVYYGGKKPSHADPT
jgi:endonuclease YncB( thermonuclease family)